MERHLRKLPKLTARRESMPPAGPRAQGWTGKCKSSHCQCLADVGVHPLAIGQDRPSRLGPAGEGRSDSGVLHLHPRGQARYPEGGRRREDEPQEKDGAPTPGLQFGLQFTAVRAGSVEYARRVSPAARTAMNLYELAPLKLLIRWFRVRAPGAPPVPGLRPWGGPGQRAPTLTLSDRR